MNEKMKLKRCIDALAFSIHEIVLFLDTHPHNRQAMSMLSEFRARRADKIKEYESRYGTFVETVIDVKPTDRWTWLDCPWPWETED
ncbi:MAG: spore coat protein CotJB [Clostridia bacterium]|nr:spore coat protein CotJB [Clostridia bacterium]